MPRKRDTAALPEAALKAESAPAPRRKRTPHKPIAEDAGLLGEAKPRASRKAAALPDSKKVTNSVSGTKFAGKAPRRAKSNGVPAVAKRAKAAQAAALDPGRCYEAIALRAYQLWEERGRVEGSPEVDWHRAEAEVCGEALVPSK